MNEFNEILELYSKSMITAFEVKDFFFKNIDSAKSSIYLDSLEKIANTKSIEDKACFLAIKSGILLFRLDKKGIEINNQALKLYKQIPNYEYCDTYLSAVNNKIVFYIKTNDISNLFYTCKYAIKIAKKLSSEKKVYYLKAILTNYLMCLLKLELYEDIITAIDSNLVMDSTESRMNVVNSYIKTIALLNLGRIKEAEDILLVISKINEKHNYYSVFNLYDLHFYLSLAKKSPEKIEEYYVLANSVVPGMPEEEVKLLILNLEYYCYKNNNIMIKKSLEQLESFLSLHKEFLMLSTKALSNAYKLIGDYSKAYNYLELSYKLKEESYKIITKNQAVSSSDFLNETQEQVFRTVYPKLEKVSIFQDLITQSLDLNFFLEAVQSEMKNIFGFDYSMIFFLNSLKDVLPEKSNLIRKEVVEEFSQGESIRITKEEISKYIPNFNCESIYLYLIKNIENDPIAILVLGFVDNKVIDIVESRFIDLTNNSIKNQLNNVLRFKMTDINAHYDMLTNIYNRLGILQEFDLQKQNGRNLSIIDIDDFKHINDTYSHLAGDFILISFAEDMAKYFGKKNVGRFGGEEFLVIDNNDEKLESFRKYIEKKKYIFNNHKIKITFSAGRSKIHSLDFEDIYKTIDEALLKAKQSGKNKIINI